MWMLMGFGAKTWKWWHLLFPLAFEFEIGWFPAILAGLVDGWLQVAGCQQLVQPSRFQPNRTGILCVIAATCKFNIKSQKNTKWQTQFFGPLCNKNYNFLQICIYFWALVFAWKIEMWNTKICDSAKSIHYLELDFGYVVSTSMCRSCAKNCTKLLKESFYINYLMLLTNLPRWLL
jgi:hypothetical protein